MHRDKIRYRRFRKAGLAAGLAGALLLAGCAKTAGKDEIGAGNTGVSEGNQTGTASGNGKETLIIGNENTVTIEGEGAAADGANVTISAAGTYRLTGNIAEGGVTVDAGKEDEVFLVLDNVSIANSGYSAIYASQSGLLTIVLEDGSENKVSDGSAYVYLQAGEDEPDAAIFSKDDMVFEGNGMLEISGNYMNGIRGKDGVIINSGTYVIGAAKDGVKGKDFVEVNGGSLAITAGSDGIQSNNDTEEDKGYVRITGGTVAITAGKKGILAETLVEVAGGAIDIDALDDSIHSDKDVRIISGELALSAGDDAVHGNNLVEVSGGTITVEQSYEGLEGLCVEITGGTIRIHSEDDGINAAGGSDASGVSNAEGTDSFGSRRGPGGGAFDVTEGAYIRISGGDIRINASGDGIDSNGDLFLEGGTVLVEGPENGGNGALDYNGTGTVSGGTILAVGSAGMFQTFSEDSSQPMLVVFFDESQSAGTTISIEDSQGNQLTETAVSKEFEALLFSSPDLKTGETYHISAGDQDIQVTVERILNQYGTPSGGGFGRMPGGGNSTFEKIPGQGGREGKFERVPEEGNVSGKASVVEIQETLLAENLGEGIHVFDGSGYMNGTTFLE